MPQASAILARHDNPNSNRCQATQLCSGSRAVEITTWLSPEDCYRSTRISGPALVGPQRVALCARFWRERVQQSTGQDARKQTKLGQGPCIASSTSIARRTTMRSSLASSWSSASLETTVLHLFPSANAAVDWLSFEWQLKALRIKPAPGNTFRGTTA